jgi:uncharacterized protein with ParB-like and HNH nuclease domain
MNPPTIGPQDILDWRKRLTAISHYILELESSLDEAEVHIRMQERHIEIITEERNTLQKKLTR